ncbi:UNVERIFIED_ORG: hypothetical protein J2Y84_004721 [Pseudomonas reinekei]|uniref:hypothetical protein n=1 Tax=Pseudomonas laurylsulfatiphila TaxID=2011015 RepID=UPI003D1F270B|nr:hypothetical protein [Pseudomonas reinekei]
MVQSLAAEFQPDEDHCRSEPARDSGFTFNRCVVCKNAFASKLAPTGFEAGL